MTKNRSSDSNSRNMATSLKSVAVYTMLLLIATDAIIDLFSKGKKYYTEHYVKSHIPQGADHMDITHIIDSQSPFTQTVGDIIIKKGGYDSIPDIISYRKNGETSTIDVSMYKHMLTDAPIGLLSERGNSEVSVATGLIQYVQKDFSLYQCILEDISSKRIGISPSDSYRGKIGKIHRFVRSLGYERDLIYLGDDDAAAILSALSDYQLPVLANLIIGKMDCNNKTGLFVQLCWIEGILVGIGSSKKHMTPVVYGDKNDPMWKFVKPNTSVGQYNGIIVDPTNTDGTSGTRRPSVAGDGGDSYTGMKFVLAQAPK